jgi:serine/threonine-protein kinase
MAENLKPLIDAPSDRREQLLDEVIADYLEALEAGRPPERRTWLARHPELADELAAFFADQDQFSCLVAPLRVAGPAMPPTPRPPMKVSLAVASAPAASPADSSVRSFGDFELLEEIARGGMGIVYKARQVSLNRIVALKTILAGEMASPADVQRFRLEAEAAANLDHPHIVPIFEIGEHDGLQYFSMKLIEGGDLRQHVPWFAGRARAAARLVRTLARAVDYAHQRGLLHRDLKPANVLLQPRTKASGSEADDWEPLITDFGLARRFQTDQGLTPSGTAVGTPSYMAPEQAGARKKALTTSADVYSLGAILYELLTGRPPFRAETPLDTLLDVLQREPQRPRALVPQLDLDLETICLKCLDKEPEKRYQSAAALAGDLQRFLDDEPIHARPINRVERFSRWCRRKPIVAGLVAALILALAGGFGLVTWQWQRAADHAHRAEVAFQSAREHLAEANRQRARAETNFRQAHQAVNDFYTGVSEDQLRQVAGLQPLRKKLLESALTYYQSFLQQREYDLSLQAELADIHARVGGISSEIGSRTEALASFQRALSIYQDLVWAEPQNTTYRVAQARIHNRIGLLQASMGQPQVAVESHEQSRRLLEKLAGAGEPALRADLAAVGSNLGNVYRGLGRLPEAQTSYEQAIHTQEELCRLHANEPAFRNALAGFYLNVGGLSADQGQWTEALRYYRRARDIEQHLLKANPRSSSYQRSLALCYRAMADVQFHNSNPPMALETLEQARGLLQEASQANPSVTQYQSDLAACLRQIGHAQRSQNRSGEALDSYEKARGLLEKLIQVDPAEMNFRNDLAKCYFDIGTIHGRQGKRAEALRCNQEARAIREKLVQASPENLGYRADLGLTCANLGYNLAKLGRFEEARAALADAMTQQRLAMTRAPQSVSYRRNLGKHYSVLAEVEQMAGRLPEAVAALSQRQELRADDAADLFDVAAKLAELAAQMGPPMSAERDRVAALAVAALRQAVAQGFKKAELLRSEHTFEVLRDRTDFQQLENDLLKQTPAGQGGGAAKHEKNAKFGDKRAGTS